MNVQENGVRKNEYSQTELRLSMSQIGKHISYYDVATGNLISTPLVSVRFGVPEVMENFPESFLANPPAGYPAQTGEMLRDMIAAIRRGEPTGLYDYPTVTTDGEKVWLRREFVTVFDEQNRPVRAVISSEEVTEQREREQKHGVDRAGLVEVAHLVFPEILACNLTKATCDVIQSVLESPKGIPLDEFLVSRLEDIAPEDHEAFRNQFFRERQLQAIAEGKDRFQLTYRHRRPDGRWHWIETTALHYKNLYDDDILTFAVSRNVDEQKAQEELLRQALAESTDRLEGWKYYDGLNGQIFPGLVYVNYIDDRPSPYVVGTLADRLDCSPKELAMSTHFRIPKEDRNVMLAAYERAREIGEQSFQAEYRVETDRGDLVWVYNHAVRFKDKYGDVGYIHYLTDTTHEHALMDQLKANMEDRLQQSEQIFSIVAQHSNRVLLYYDIATKEVRLWGKETQDLSFLTRFYSKDSEGKWGLNAQNIMPESAEAIRQCFAAIHRGVPSGEINVNVRVKDGTFRWFHVKYSSLFNGGQTISALISAEDITERHEYELAYLHREQAVIRNKENYLLYMESCLTMDRIEKISGQLLSEEEKQREYTHGEFVRMLQREKFHTEGEAKPLRYLNRENLLRLYKKGERKVEREAEVRFRDGSLRWLNVEITMITDPLNGYVKIFTQIKDITDEKNESIDLRQKADYDVMTRLLHRGVGEARVRELLKKRSSPGGVLIIVDLDDLKNINDTLGHACGDRALIGIADAMKSHFRRSDVLIRAGGDEFMAFLPGAGDSVGSVGRSLKSLLQKFSTISLGGGSERTIHCSIGCAVELPDTDTFDSLYRRADIALYHVKRKGKNAYAFFEPEMLESSYRFKTDQMAPVVQEMVAQTELKQLLNVLSVDYPGIVSFNLTQNQSCVLSIGSNVAEFPAAGRIEDFLEGWKKDIHEDDQQYMLAALSRSSLFASYTQGKRRERFCYRNREVFGFVRTELDVRIYTAENGDVCAFLFFRWDEDAKENAR